MCVPLFIYTCLSYYYYFSEHCSWLVYHSLYLHYYYGRIILTETSRVLVYTIFFCARVSLHLSRKRIIAEHRLSTRSYDWKLLTHKLIERNILRLNYLSLAHFPVKNVSFSNNLLYCRLKLCSNFVFVNIAPSNFFFCRSTSFR